MERQAARRRQVRLFIEKYPGSQPSTISARFDFTPTYAQMLLDTMEELGQVERRGSARYYLKKAVEKEAFTPYQIHRLGQPRQSPRVLAEGVWGNGLIIGTGAYVAVSRCRAKTTVAILCNTAAEARSLKELFDLTGCGKDCRFKPKTLRSTHELIHLLPIATQ